MLRQVFSYLAILLLFVGLIAVVIQRGNHLQVKKAAPAVGTVSLSAEAVHASQRDSYPLSGLLVQILVIVIVARVFGLLAKWMQQPVVIGEIIAGICLGPSLLGWLWPSASTWLFPEAGMKPLLLLSQLGLIFYMFIVGMELDLPHIRRKARAAVMISHVSIVFPFFLGVVLAYFIYGRFALPGVSFLAFALFMGIATGITAFPVLARIVQERKLGGTPLGNMAISCAATDDITAWCMLAAVVAIVKSASPVSWIVTISCAIAFIALMLVVIKPWLRKKIEHYAALRRRKTVVALVFLVLLGSAWTTELIGIHALFGAFLAGTIMPAAGTVKKLLINRVEDISTLLLLPIYFVYTGLHTQIGLIDGKLWLVFGFIMLVAVGGKLGGSAVTARLMGYSWPQALALGSLMNTRGLMELVVLNIGYDLGILSREIFALMVLMALLTTMMTGPLLSLFLKTKPRPSTHDTGQHNEIPARDKQRQMALMEENS